MYQMGTVPVGISCMHRIAYHSSSAHPSLLHPIPCQPTHLHCASLSGPPVSIAPYPLSAHLPPLCLIYRPTCLHRTLPFIICYIVHCYTTIYTIYHRPIQLHQVHTTLGPLVYIRYTPPSAHSSIMVQLLPWAHMGWPICIGTLSPLAVCLIWVNSLKGLIQSSFNCE